MAQQKIRTFLWYDTEAEVAARHYVAAFKNSSIDNVFKQHGSDQSFIIEFTIAGQQYVAMNAVPLFPPNESFSFFVECDDQAEVDRLWSHLLKDGGKESACGWLKDRWGFSWQIVPRIFMDMMKSKDAAASGRAMQAMMQMVKFDIAALEKAFAGQPIT